MPKGDNQKGKRRGRYRAAPTATPAAVFAARVGEREETLLAAAKRRLTADHPGAQPTKDRDWTGAESAARQLAQLELRVESMLAGLADGTLSVDESKTLPRMSSEIRNLRAELGLRLYNEKGEPIEDGEDPY
jgi:hypothetical protein